MRSMLHLARFHPSFGHPNFAHPGFAHPGFAHGSSWVTHMIVSSVIHGLIYSVIFRVLRHLSLGEVVLLAVVVIGLLYAGNRNRTYRRW